MNKIDKLLKKRLEILKDAGEIDEEIMVATIEFVQSLEKKYSLEIEEKNGAMLVTHISMALARIKRGEKIDGMDKLALNEIMKTEIYKELPGFYKKIEESLKIKIPDSEKGFVAVHVAALIDKCK